MGSSPYREGQRAFANCYGHNPYTNEFRRKEWQDGYDDATAASYVNQAVASERRNSLWNVPEDAKDAYIAMEDDFSAARVLEFMLAMLESGKEDE